MRRSQRAYAEALTTYQNETLPQYQQELGRAEFRIYVTAQDAYNQADTSYQMAFAQWQADQSDENAQALDEAESSKKSGRDHLPGSKGSL